MTHPDPTPAEVERVALLRDLARAKALFQLRALIAAMGIDPNTAPVRSYLAGEDPRLCKRPGFRVPTFFASVPTFVMVLTEDDKPLSL